LEPPRALEGCALGAGGKNDVRFSSIGAITGAGCTSGLFANKPLGIAALAGAMRGRLAAAALALDMTGAVGAAAAGAAATGAGAGAGFGAGAGLGAGAATSGLLTSGLLDAGGIATGAGGRTVIGAFAPGELVRSDGDEVGAGGSSEARASSAPSL
jgi:hypothetical protein